MTTGLLASIELLFLGAELFSCSSIFNLSPTQVVVPVGDMGQTTLPKDRFNQAGPLQSSLIFAFDLLQA